MRKISAFILTLTVLFSGIASYATVVMTTPIPVPNITRWQVVRYVDKGDDVAETELPYAVVTVDVFGWKDSARVTYQSYALRIYDAPGKSCTIARNPVNGMYFGKIIVNCDVAISGAYTAVSDTYTGTPGGKAAKKLALEGLLPTLGIVVDMNGT
jgi:hypothetical protein